MRNVLLTGLSATAVAIGLSAAATSASAETATGVYGIVDATAVDTDASDKSYIFGADGNLKIQDGHGIGAGVTGTTAQDYEKKSNAGAWESGTGTALDREIAPGQAIVTTANGQGTLTFENTAGLITVTGSVGESDKALKAIAGSAGGAIFVSDVFTGNLTVNGGNIAMNGGLSASAGVGTTVTFDTDHTLEVGDNAILGTVTGANNQGTLNLGGQTNTIIAIATGLKALVLSGPSEATTTIANNVTGLGLAAIGAGTSLTLLGATAEITTTTLDNDSVFNIGDTEVTGDITANAGGIGAVTIGKGTGGKNINSVIGNIGAAGQGVAGITYLGGTDAANARDEHHVTDGVYANKVDINGTGILILDKTLTDSYGAGTNVTFYKDGHLTVGGKATLGAVTTIADSSGSMTLGAYAPNTDHVAESIGSAGARLNSLEIVATTGNASLTVNKGTWVNALYLNDISGESTATFNGDATLGKVSVTTTEKNNVFLNGLNNTATEIGATNTSLGTLTLGKDAGLVVTGTTDANGVVTGGANVKSVTLNGMTNSLALGEGTTNEFTNGIGAAGTSALKSLSLGAGSTTTASAGGVYAQKTTLLGSDKKDSLGAILTSMDANSALGDVTLGLGYNKDSLVNTNGFSSGNVLAGTTGVLAVNSVAVNASNAAAVGLGDAWAKRLAGDTAVVAGKDVLSFATGNLTLTDGTAVDFTGDALVAGGDDFGTAKNLLVSDNLALWNFRLGQNSTTNSNASLLAVQDAAGFRSRIAAGGANMTNFGGVVDGMISVINDVNADPVLRGFISNQTTNQVAVVTQQMADLSVNNGISNSSRAVGMAAANAITANIGGGTGTSVASNSVVSGINAGDVTKRNTAWVQVIGSWNEQDRRKGVDGYSADTYGFALGADTLVSETTRLGLALHYANTNVDGKGVFARNNADINTYGVTLYGQQNLTDALFLDGRLGYAYNDVSSERRINGLDGKADSSYGAHQFDIAAKLGYNAKVASNTTLTPHVGLGYTYLGENSYTESGNVARLHVGSRDTNALLIGAGVRGAVEFETAGKTKIIPEIRLGASYDALASEMNTTARFVGGGTAFTTRNVKPDPWTFNVGAGVNVATTGNLTVSANYDAALSGNFTGHTGSLRGKLKF